MNHKDYGLTTSNCYEDGTMFSDPAIKTVLQSAYFMGFKPQCFSSGDSFAISVRTPQAMYNNSTGKLCEANDELIEHFCIDNSTGPSTTVTILGPVKQSVCPEAITPKYVDPGK